MTLHSGKCRQCPYSNSASLVSSHLSVTELNLNCKLEHAKPITLHANGEPLLKSGGPQHILYQSAMILLVVWSAKGNGSPLTSKASSKVNLLNDDNRPMSLCDCNCVILRARCTLYS